MRSSSVNSLSRLSGSSHLKAASLICAPCVSRLSVFSAACAIALLPGFQAVSLEHFRRRQNDEPAVKASLGPGEVTRELTRKNGTGESACVMTRWLGLQSWA